MRLGTGRAQQKTSLTSTRASRQFVAMTTSSHLPKRPGAAFTLVELLTVIGIIGILAAIIIPLTNRSREQARQAQCAANMRQYLLATPLFAADNRGRLPECVHSSQATVEVRTQLAPYLSPPSGLSEHELFVWSGTISCASTVTTSQGRTWVHGFNASTSQLVLSAIGEPSRLVYMIDTTGSRAIRSETLTGLPNDFRQAAPRPHGGRVNAGYLDGHVSPLLASTLVRADFTRGTPSWVASHEHNLVTTPAYDK